MAIVSNVMGGFQLALVLTGMLAAGRVISSYLLPGGQDLGEFIEARTGLNTAGEVAY